jgi:hypothetical protein
MRWYSLGETENTRHVRKDKAYNTFKLKDASVLILQML